jgi:hypothetical protein
LIAFLRKITYLAVNPRGQIFPHANGEWKKEKEFENFSRFGGRGVGSIAFCITTGRIKINQRRIIVISNRFTKVYVDTSVVGGKFDPEYSRQTAPFWNAVINGEIRIMASEVLKGELEGAPAHVREFFN